MNYSFECLVIIMNRCINLLNDNNPFLLNFIRPLSFFILFSSTVYNRFIKSVSRAFSAWGSICALASRVSRNLAVRAVYPVLTEVIVFLSSFYDLVFSDFLSKALNSILGT
jgi:hypothetical protein